MMRPFVKILAMATCLASVSPLKTTAAAAQSPAVTAATTAAATAEPVSAAAASANVPAVALRSHRLRGLTAEVAGLVWQKDALGDLPIEVLATATDLPATDFFVEIDGATLLSLEPSETTRVEVYVYALGAEASIVGYLAEAFALDLRQLGEAIWQSGVKFQGRLELPAGQYSLVVLTRLFHSKAFGRRVLDLTVPPADQPQVSLQFAGPQERDTWLLAKQSDLSSYGPSFVPACRPLLVAGKTARAQLVASKSVAIPSDGSATTAKIRFLRTDGSVATRVDGQISHHEGEFGDDANPDGDSEGGSEDAEAGVAEGSAATTRPWVSFNSPDLEPGVYDLQVDLQIEPAGKVRPAPPLPVYLLGDETAARELLWTDLRWLNDAATPPGDASSQANARQARQRGESRRQAKKKARARKRRVRQLADEYLQVLRKLANESPDAARAALLDLESASLGTQANHSAMELLRQAELQAAERLAEQDSKTVLSILMLHNQLHETYSQRRLYSLIAHSRAVMESLSTLHSDSGHQSEAAQALAGVAGYLQNANLPGSSRRLFNLAIDMDPGCSAALLGLAASQEKYGVYPQAIRYYELLTEAAPDLSEGWLRLGINRARRSDRKGSRAALSRAWSNTGPSWVRSVAAQEMARSLLANNELPAAAEWLDAARQELPGQRGLLILSAHVYDRMQRPHRAFDLTSAVRPDSQQRSPRWLYDSWPQRVLQDDRQRLEELSRQRLPALAAALKSLEGDAP